jgi:thiol-disulfide isomerase/thioredoxin
MIAIRFVGGNRTSAPSKQFACRDGYGARVAVDLGDEKLVREHRCGDGWAAQNSPTMIVGVGSRPTAASISVRWPSGKRTSVKDVPEGTLLTAYENPADSPSGEAFTRNPYRIKQTAPPTTMSARPVFPVRIADTAAKPARLRVYTTFTIGSPSCISQLPMLRRLKEELSSEGVDIVAVPIDEADDNPKLAAYAKQWKPSSRLVNIAPAKRAEAIAAYTKVLGEEPPLPSSVITDDSGHILSALPGVPSISALRKMLPLDP